MTVSIREYGRRKNVSDTAIRKMIKAGKIVKGLVYENGIPRINIEEADKEFTLYESSPTRGAKKEPEVKAEQQKRVTPPKQHPEPKAPEPHPEPPAGTLAATKLITAKLKAKDLELKVKKLQGLLVDKSKVYSALFSFGKEMRVNMQAIPDRFIDDILSAGSRNEAHTILFNAISDALESLTDLSKTDLAK